MRVRLIRDNRDLVIRVMEEVSGEKVVYKGLPDFSYSVSGCTLLRSGEMEAVERGLRICSELAKLGMSELPYEVKVLMGNDATFSDMDIVYPAAGFEGKSLMNLLSMISARQYYINRGLETGGALRIDRSLMDRLLRRPPEDMASLLQMLYGRDNEYSGVKFSLEEIVFTCFRMCQHDERFAHRQLTDLMMDAACRQQWAKPYTKNVRNKKYAFRIWLNSIGMIGDEYEKARTLMLSRMYGRSDGRSMSK